MYMTNYSKKTWDPIFDAFFGCDSAEQNGRFLMRTDIYEDGDSYRLEVELPGFEKDNIHLALDEGYLTISVKSEAPKDEKGKERAYLSRERFYGSASRRFYVGQLEEDEIKAAYANGILTVTFPKEEARKQKTNRVIAID